MASLKNLADRLQRLEAGVGDDDAVDALRVGANIIQAMMFGELSEAEAADCVWANEADENDRNAAAVAVYPFHVAPLELGLRGLLQRQRKVRAVMARQLGNTKAVCRKCYVRPAILDSYLQGTLAEVFQRRSEEAAVLALLRARKKRNAGLARRSGADGRSLVPILARSLAIARKHSDVH